MKTGLKRICAVVSAAGLAMTLGCARPPQPDAYGNVEATEVVVGAEAAGRLLTFDVTEGRPSPAARSSARSTPRS